MRERRRTALCAHAQSAAALPYFVAVLIGCVLGAALPTLLPLQGRPHFAAVMTAQAAAAATALPPRPQIGARNRVLSIPEFTHVCRDAAYSCLGAARADAATSCGAVAAAASVDDAASASVAAAQAARRAVYWREQLAGGGGTSGAAAPIEGWLDAGDAAATAAILQAQARVLGVYGHMSEIGVHHGKFLIWLALHARAGERAVGLDLFETAQAENLDGSGSGSLARLRANAMRYAAPGAVEALPINSLRLPLCFFHEQRLQGVRFFSVDGGHYVDHAYEDCWSAWSALAPGGVIAVDDFLHGVSVLQGTLRFLDAAADARAFFIGPNKVYICHRDYYQAYFRAMSAAFPGLAVASFGASEQLTMPPTAALTLHGWLLGSVLERGREIWHCGQLSQPYVQPEYAPE
jgi:hypothetical protein